MSCNFGKLGLFGYLSCCYNTLPTEILKPDVSLPVYLVGLCLVFVIFHRVKKVSVWHCWKVFIPRRIFLITYVDPCHMGHVLIETVDIRVFQSGIRVHKKLDQIKRPPKTQALVWTFKLMPNLQWWLPSKSTSNPTRMSIQWNRNFGKGSTLIQTLVSIFIWLGISIRVRVISTGKWSD